MGIVYRLRKILGKETFKYVDITSLIENINQIGSNNYKHLAVCLDNTGSSFLGVKNATLNLFPNSTIVLPAYYGNTLLTHNQFVELSEVILKNGFNQLILSAFPGSMNKLIDLIAEKINIKVIFHGALSELSDEKSEKRFFNMIELARNGHIKKIGFVKSGLDIWCSELFNVPTSLLLLKPLQYKNQSNKIIDSKIKIGVFGNNTFNKNTYNQIAAALLIPDAEVHTTIDTKFPEFGFKIKVHPFMNHEDFLNLLSQMDLNLHLSFSEGMGGQVFTESLSQGVPCLTSYNNEYLKFDKEILELFTVQQYENPWQIKNAINRVFNSDQDWLKQKMISYNSVIEKEHDNLLENFLFT